MRATDQRSLSADDTHDMTDREDLAVPSDPAPGMDPGEGDTWEIIRVHCPECRRPIALVGDEERLPQHAVLPTAWHPFSPALCPGSGAPTDDLAEVETAEDAEPTGLEGLLTLPAELDWRTQPFSHAVAHRPVRAATAPSIPEQRSRARLARR
ncbi:hypothetical protein RMN57_08005 [Kitasatospora sp. CM 4170]|uniref:Uncharacterized protein n=1 Tax=Kitasatospora aburaviensis TaxID=67265 RepID=A0ABW1EQS4_9ACTN|nr:hypothetical protein [Kitasatospora sp. CM 4170]WNM44662.1 hypothetical protein RMN57_08005 [Kitasatospora sp. CM 4170]